MIVMDITGLIPIFSKNVRKSSFFSSTFTLLGSKPVSLIIEGITYPCLKNHDQVFYVSFKM